MTHEEPPVKCLATLSLDGVVCGATLGSVGASACLAPLRAAAGIGAGHVSVGRRGECARHVQTGAGAAGWAERGRACAERRWAVGVLAHIVLLLRRGWGG